MTWHVGGIGSGQISLHQSNLGIVITKSQRDAKNSSNTKRVWSKLVTLPALTEFSHQSMCFNIWPVHLDSISPTLRWDVF